MSHRRKHLTHAALNADSSALPESNESILRATRLCGSNLLEAELPDGTTTLCRIPAKFNKTLWVKPGSFLLAQLGDSDDKVNGEVTRVLYAEHVKLYKKEPGLWPVEFNAPTIEEADMGNQEEQDSDDDNLPALEANMNHRGVQHNDDSSSEDEH
mmetsp:Transcript_48186/g.92112  ORF Transcript_48186/g.92112 Transcript_48186/m.92112 type:complete len:155 (-) Transcript_48186:122-586(-)|eukprot:CAMPEP_0114256788 /NCGR_PEP_ID=MMETSP0058-20121206/18366_1 /TAXON_ID=36894 /ORGANISM="Pyramimonas parkeae, CCMP726" /LENGTH=154 /DNA_ID=CAMNT_0001371431 /DNA_START=142 /DNA_END=606 /DNA_ORIENTATION=+